MKTFVSDYTAQLKAPQHTITNLFRFDFSHTYRFTSFASDIFYGGYWYRSKNIRFDEARFQTAPQIETLELNIDNVDNWFSDLCLSESITGKEVYVYQAAIDNNLSVIGQDLMFFGYADRRTLNQRTGRLSVKNHMAHWRRQVPGLHTATCRWVFKHTNDEVIGTDAVNYSCKIDHPATADNRPITGAQWASFWVVAGSSGVTWVLGTDYHVGTCAYAGVATWCDQSWERCLALGNTANFGGNRWLPFLEDKVIWWGRVPRKDGK